jgi:hypothetical protein
MSDGYWDAYVAGLRDADKDRYHGRARQVELGSPNLCMNCGELAAEDDGWCRPCAAVVRRNWGGELTADHVLFQLKYLDNEDAEGYLVDVEHLIEDVRYMAHKALGHIGRPNRQAADAGELLAEYLLNQERFEWTPDDLYSMGRRAATFGLEYLGRY